MDITSHIYNTKYPVIKEVLSLNRGIITELIVHKPNFYINEEVFLLERRKQTRFMSWAIYRLKVKRNDLKDYYCWQALSISLFISATLILLKSLFVLKPLNNRYYTYETLTRHILFFANNICYEQWVKLTHNKQLRQMFFIRHFFC